jgi:alkylhydroperoxidase family enzyme
MKSNRIAGLLAKKAALMNRLAMAQAQEARDTKRLKARQQALVGKAVLIAIQRKHFSQDQFTRLLQENLSERELQAFKV